MSVCACFTSVCIYCVSVHLILLFQRVLLIVGSIRYSATCTIVSESFSESVLA